MQITREIQVAEWDDEVIGRVLAYLRARGFDVDAEGAESEIVGKRGSWIGNFTSFDMTRLRARISLTADADGVLRIVLDVNTFGQHITEWNVAVWRLELVEIGRVCHGLPLLPEVWKRFRRDDSAAARRWLFSLTTSGKRLSAEWEAEIGALEEEVKSPPSELPGSAPLDGVCATHPDLPAEIICSRCGDFACIDCAWEVGEDDICDECYARTWGVRREHVRSERAIQQTASGLFFLASLGGAVTLVFWLFVLGGGDVQAWTIAISGSLVVPFAWFAARDLRHFRPRGRVLGIIYALLVLPGFPVGTIIGVGVIFNLLRHGVVFSAPFREAYEATRDE